MSKASLEVTLAQLNTLTNVPADVLDELAGKGETVLLGGGTYRRNQEMPAVKGGWRLQLITRPLPRDAAADVEVEGKVAYSDSTSWYDPLGRRNSIRDTNSPTAGNVTFRAQRSSPTSVDWQFTQVAGPDIRTLRDALAADLVAHARGAGDVAGVVEGDDAVIVGVLVEFQSTGLDQVPGHFADV